ncbi:MAG: DUF3078 domain-containing protein [Patescibacteria group bacterium]|nr:DUF3078 domain-containing protein [Patescibacteria group bacterium]
MKNLILLFILFFPFFNNVFSQNYRFNGKFNFGGTYNSFNTDNTVNENFEILLSFYLFNNYNSESFLFDSDFFIQYGQIIRKNHNPTKTQDQLILNLIPSIKLLNIPSIRLFLQTKGETQLRKGYIDDQVTNFADPLFLTNTLFLGEKSKILEQTDTQEFNITYGLGYSFQNIIRNKFNISDEIEHSSDAEFKDGPTAVFNLNFSKLFNNNLSLMCSFNSIMLIKKFTFEDSNHLRFTSMLLAELKLYFVTFMYTNRFVLDKEISNSPQNNNSLILGFTINF